MSGNYKERSGPLFPLRKNDIQFTVQEIHREYDYDEDGYNLERRFIRVVRLDDEEVFEFDISDAADPFSVAELLDFAANKPGAADVLED